MWVCQTAIFEVWFYFGEDAMRELREVAFGEYDWTQAHATQVLCRLARRGLDARATAELIAEALPEWRYEQVMRVCDPVAGLAPFSPALRKAYDRLVDRYLEGDPIDAFELVSASASADVDARSPAIVPWRVMAPGPRVDGSTPSPWGYPRDT